MLVEVDVLTLPDIYVCPSASRCGPFVDSVVKVITADIQAASLTLRKYTLLQFVGFDLFSDPSLAPMLETCDESIGYHYPDYNSTIEYSLQE